MFSEQFGRVVFRTKLAQVYPVDMCVAIAETVAQFIVHPLAHLAPSFALQNPKGDRKRPLGQTIAWSEHRQKNSALAAVASGYQLKRGAMKPLVDVECEPGQAIHWVMNVSHPFSVSEALPDMLATAIGEVAQSAQEVNLFRKRSFATVASTCSGLPSTH